MVEVEKGGERRVEDGIGRGGNVRDITGVGFEIGRIELGHERG